MATATVLLIALLSSGSANAAGTADEIHYTFMSATSVTFDWRGTATDIRYGPTTAYGTTATSHAPSIMPFSSPGPFQEVQLNGLSAGTRYHYSIGGGPDQIFATAPTGNFRFDVEADVGSSLNFSNVTTTQEQIAADSPNFVLVVGDFTYAHPWGQAAVDQFFNDVMPWSQSSAFMPAWGNHEWEAPTEDDLRNYKGRFSLPNPYTASDAPAAGCCGEDASWFDAGGVRFISYPEPYTSATWNTWASQIEPVFAAAQADPSIKFIVTFGHRPAYSTGLHQGDTNLASILNTFGDRYSKYVLNFNGHSHDYERYSPIHGVTHITAAGGGSPLEPPWLSTDSRTAFRAMHLEHVRVDVSPTGMRIEAICGPPTSADDIQCVQGTVMDSDTIGTNPPPPPPPPPILYVDKSNPLCSDGGSGTASQPFCTIRPAASRVLAGQTVLVGNGTYNEQVTVSGSGTASAPIVFAAAPGATPALSGSTDGFYINGKSYITVQGFTITGTSGDGIVVKNGCSNIRLEGNHVSFSGQPANGKSAKGIRVEDSSNSIIENNTVDHNSSYGIYVPSSTGILVHDNNSSNNAFGYQRAASGIRLYDSDNNTVSGNLSHDNEDSGIDVDTSNNNLLFNNVIYNNGDHGIDNTNHSTGNRIISNTVYKSVTSGINVEGTSTGVTIANNISMDNGIASPRTHSDIRVESGSTPGTTLDYDLLNLSTPDTLVIWNSIAYTTLPALRAASGQEMHGIQADPRFVNAAGGNLHLLTGSPAIDSANSGASGQPAQDADDNERVDDPATPNTGAGPRAFDDRGAYEYQAPPVDHMVISPTAPTITAGGSQAFTAQGFDAGGNLIGDVTSSTSFSIAPDGSCAANTCTATVAGPHTITATNGRAMATTSLSVNAGALDHLALSPATGTITSGGSQAYTAEGRDQYNNSLGDRTSTTSFTIAPNGSCTGATCTAATAGTHTVTGTSTGKTGSASLTVTAGTANHILISPSSASMTAGGSQTYTAQSFDSAGNPVADVTAFTTFTITPDGSCTAATCTATTAGPHTVTGDDLGMTSAATLTVNPGPLDHLALTPASSGISAGGSQAYSADGRDQYDNSLGDVTSTTSFTIAPNGSCTAATCTASTAGAHTVTGTKAGKTGTATLNVAGGSLDHLVLSPASATISSGGSQSYTATAFDSSNNSLGDATAQTTFTIAPNGSCVLATCTATIAGPHTVTGTDGSVSASASLQVNASTMDHIVISPSSATITAGGSQSFTAQAFDSSNNSLGDVTAQTTFTIAPDGSCTAATCTATTAGPHTVTANDSGKTSTASLTVVAAPLDHLVLAPATASISTGGSQTYTAEGRDQYNNSLGDVTSATTFTIAPDGSCTSATCTATAAGPHTVTGTDAGKTGTAALSVTAVTIDHIAISPASSSIGTGGSQTYTAEAFDGSNSSLGDATAQTTFTIAPDGSCTGATCTATIAGPHTVTGTDGSVSATASLQVNASTMDHIVISPSSATITAGGSQSFTAQAFDSSNNSLGDVTAQTTFTIAPDGSCTGATCTTTTAGPHTVTGTDAGKTSAVTLTVNAGPVDHLVLTPASATITSGGSKSYVARTADQYGNVISDVTPATTFTIAPDGTCSAATCTASTAGAHVVTGTSSGKTGTATLQVNAGPLDHITVGPSTATVSLGGSQTYTAQGFDAANNPLGDVTSQTVFTIAPDGSCSAASCTANTGGPHTVTGNDAGQTATAALAVSFVRNSGFEADLSGWNTSGSGANITLARVTGGHSGSWAAKLANTGSTPSTFATLQDTPNWVATTVAGTYTASVWVRADTPGAVLKLKIQEYSGSTLVSSASSQISLSTDWQRVTLAYAVKSPGSTLDTQMYVSNPAPGTAFYADDVSIVLG
ncbi:MAG TPA: right-handed parallel beta-helix repeat-containing protein [Gaiellales bacterium]|nr:right-handed parallel beta-helix repeat-containing protein [Gaiellales bacterium]